VQINNISFQVIAVMEAKGYLAGVNEDDALRYPLPLWQSGVMDSNLLSYIQISAKDHLSIRAATFQITNVMNIMLVSVNEYTQEICWLNEL
jgi:putative ABC transport system permease protein